MQKKNKARNQLRQIPGLWKALFEEPERERIFFERDLLKCFFPCKK
jgi:hypothetical protein